MAHPLIHKTLICLLAPKRIRVMRHVQNCQKWQEQEVKKYQEQRLQQLIEYCWKYVPFYRSRWQGFIDDPRDIQCIEDLPRLPLLTKEELREELANITTTASWIKSDEARSGGSTGRPTIFRMSKEDQESMWGQLYLGWHWAGYRLGDPYLIVGGESIGAGLTDNRTKKDAIINRWVFSGSNLTVDRVKTLAQSSYFKKIRFIYGYPNAIRELGELLHQIGARFPNLNGVVCTAEVMLPEVRERIKKTLGADVFDQYGLNDGGLLAVEGPEHDGLHLFLHRGLLEILDDDNRQINNLKQPGRAIATCLTNWATPFIRYETGDVVHWHSKEPSTDGKIGWPRIGPVDGRTGDVLYLPSGRSIAMPGLTLVMRWLDGLHQYQFIQTSENSIVARLDSGPDFKMSEQEVIDYLKQKITDEIEWQIVWDKPELTANNKLLIIKNDWLKKLGLTRPSHPAKQ